MKPRVTLFHKIFWRVAWTVFGFTFVPFSRVWARGFRQLPRTGPYMLVGNHVTFLDPAIMAFFCVRRVHFMGSTHWFPIPIIGHFLRAIGSFPKTKFTKDREAMRTLQDYWDEGEVVSVFPEGRRTWNGCTQPILPRLGRLIKRLDATVVFCRFTNGYHGHPRWAPLPRSLPGMLEYDPPYRFPPEATEAEIEAEVQRRIHVDITEMPPPRRAFGFRLATGLPNVLWACPTCFALETVRVDPKRSDRVDCTACGAGWRIDVGCRLHADTGEVVHLTHAIDGIAAHFGDPPIADKAAFEAEGIVLRDPDTILREVKRGKTILARGEAVLTVDEIQVRGETGTWRVPLVDIVSVSIENIRVFQFRLEGRLLQLDLPGRSVVRWQHFLNPWRLRARS